MITFEPNEQGFNFLIGNKVVPLSLSDVSHLKRLMDSVYRDGVDPCVNEAAYGKWVIKPAGEYEHPWEKRRRSILCFGDMKWHFTESEMERIYDSLPQ